MVYDALCNPELLRFAPSEAEKIYAGKKAGAHTLPQEEINARLIEYARAGRRVVRLKGGDPFVFGRGGEEAEALAAAGIEFEIVPGISSAMAGPAYAGIPVTHRDHASVLSVFTGHENPEKSGTAIPYAELARAGGTRVLLMGVERLDAITRELIANGASADLPAAIIQSATTPRQRTVKGTLGDIAAKAAEAGIGSPAVAVFGTVVSLRDTLNWHESRPLYGKRIAVTRSRRQAGALVRQLRAWGADAYELPTIRIEPPEDLREFAETVQDAHLYDWIIFTSPNGVDAFFGIFFKLYNDLRSIGGARIASIGPATSERLRAFHLGIDIEPEKHVAEAILEELEKTGSVENLKFLLPRAAGAREVLGRELTRKGAIVDEVAAYRTVPETGDPTGGVARFQSEGADLITFTSASTVENFLRLGLVRPKGLLTASIGPITSEALRASGLDVDVEARSSDIPGLVAAIVSRLSE